MSEESALERRLHSLVAPIVSDLGLELYDLDYAGGVLKVTIDTLPGSPGGVDVDALAQCTRLVSRELDHTDPIPGHYTLEVSSPGLERTLRTPRHFQREIGKTVSIRLRDVGNTDRRLTGVLVAADDTACTVRVDGTAAAPIGDDRVVPHHLLQRIRDVLRGLERDDLAALLAGDGRRLDELGQGEVPRDGQRGRAAESPPGNDGAQGLGDLHRPAAVERRIRAMGLQRELLQHQPAGYADRKHPAGHMAGTDVNG